MNSLTITTLGKPRPKQSMRWVNGRPVGIVQANAKLGLWTKQILQACHDAASSSFSGVDASLFVKICSTAVRLDATFYIPVKNKKKWGQHHTAVPDEDNLRKAAKDALQKAGIVKDDSRIVGGETWKFWAKEGGVTLKLTPIGLEPDQDDPSDVGLGYIAT